MSLLACYGEEGGGRWRNRDIQRKSLDREREMILFFVPGFSFFLSQSALIHQQESHKHKLPACV